MGAVVLFVVVVVLGIPICLLKRAMRASPRSRFHVGLWVAVTLGVAGYITHFFFAPLGYIAMRVACAKDGGERIFEYVNVPGYWYRYRPDFSANECYACATEVTKGEYEYVDYDFPDAVDLNRQHYIRYSLGSAGDPKCQQSDPRELRDQSRCLMRTELPGRSDTRYVYSLSSGSFRGLVGIVIGRLEHIITDQIAQRDIAVSESYGVASPFAKSVGSGTYGCYPPIEHIDFKDRVLKAKVPSSPRS
jgi:hypothetical protein